MRSSTLGAIELSMVVGAILAETPSRVRAQPCIAPESPPLTASDGESLDNFGYSVALDGNIAAAIANLDNCAAGSWCGSGYVFQQTETGWFQEAKLDNPFAHQGDMLQSIAVSGDVVVTGTVFNDCPGREGTGSAFVFERDEGGPDNWGLVGKLCATDSDITWGNYGWTVAVDGNVALVGRANGVCSDDQDECPTSDVRECGAAYIFRRGMSTWDEEQKLTPFNEDRPCGGAQFGTATSVSGNVAVVTSLLENCPHGSKPNCGAAYIYRYDGASWAEEQRLFEGTSCYGSSVSVSGDVVIVGSWTDSSCGSGAVHIYRFDGATWTSEATLLQPPMSTGQGFGSCVSIDGDLALVKGATEDCGGFDCPVIYAYRRCGTTWVLDSKLRAPGAGIGVGQCVSVSGNLGMVGAPAENSATGAVREYQIQCPETCPTVTTWGLLSLALLASAAGTIIVRHRSAYPRQPAANLQR